ncbi:MAG: hypothetical protein H6510_16710 [Acidobacteria bacterium]|nr:hypothetical protein [Acidobacteriota bacterium]MCB9399457.1 hypothetical protein [Acidobacteriota bacterium]
MERVLIWVDRTGWQDVFSGVSGSWIGTDPFPGIKDLLKQLSPAETTLWFSPDFFFLTRLSAAQLTQVSTHLQQNFALKPGRWTWQVHLSDDDTGLVLAMPNTYAQSLETLFLESQQTLHIALVPAQSTFSDGHFVIGNFRLRVQAGPHGWDAWGPSRESADGPPFFLAEDPTFLHWETESERQMNRLQGLSRLCLRVLIGVAAIALLSVAYLAYAGQQLQRKTQIAQTYINDHFDESQHLESLANSGNVAWEKLRQIQAFSRRHLPVAHRVAQLSAGLPAGLKWTDFRWQDDSFSITLEGEQLQLLLDYVDFVRQVPGTQNVSFEEFKMKHRTQQFLGKVQGTFP